jgi:hypothetical protein
VDEGGRDGRIVRGSLYYNILGAFARKSEPLEHCVGIGVSLQPMIVFCEFLIPETTIARLVL